MGKKNYVRCGAPQDIKLIEFRPWLGLTASQERQYAKCKEHLAKMLLNTWPAKYGWLNDSKEMIANEAACDVLLDVHLLKLPRPSFDGELPEKTRAAAFRRRADLCATFIRTMNAYKRSASPAIPMDEIAEEAMNVAVEPTAETLPLKLALGDVLSRISPEDVKLFDMRLDGLSFDDIAKVMGVNKTTISRRIRKYRQLVAAAIENHFFFTGRCNKPAKIAENVNEE